MTMTTHNLLRESRWRRVIQRVLRVSGGIVLAALITLALLLYLPLPKTPNLGKTGDFIVSNVAVVDVVNGQVVPGRDVVVRNGRIASVGETGAASAEGGLSVVDAAGKFLIPGLWDMHVHSLKIAPQYSHPLSIANGVTGVREMWGCPDIMDSFVACGEDIDRWRSALQDRSQLAPRYIMRSSYAINGEAGVPGSAPEFFKARNADEGRAIAAHEARSGVDLIKVYTDIPLNAYEALAAEASRRGVRVAGHLPVRIPLRTVMAAGQHSVEHPRIFLFECYRGAAEFRALPHPMRAYTTDMRARFIDDHDWAFCSQLMAEMAESDTWWTPTLQVLRMSAFAELPEFRNDPRQRYIPAAFWKGLWKWDADGSAARSRNAAGRPVDAELYALAKETVRQAHEAGVRIVAGTDAGDTYVFPGFAIHDELEELVLAGISPLDALQMATIDAARFADKSTEYGSIEAGKVADMLLLDANPLIVIHNTQKIAGLFFNGQYFDREALDELLLFAEEQASSLRTNMQLLWGALRSRIIWAQAQD